MRAEVLVVDDEPSSRDGLRSLLERWGYEVETAIDGQMALEKTLVRRPSLIIADVAMPRLNGLELLQVLRNDSPEIPVIILTGQNTIRTPGPAQGTRQGAFGHLTKPLDVSRLKMLIAEALPRKG